jgi:hypothetical protein
MTNRFYLMGLAALLSLSTVTANASGVESKEAIVARVATMTAAQKEANVNAIKLRVEEIRNMDKSTLTRAERKELRSELRAMKFEANASSSGGIYLSLGAIIIVILLLILIL